jgi:hypothetical protein
MPVGKDPASGRRRPDRSCPVAFSLAKARESLRWGREAIEEIQYEIDVFHLADLGQDSEIDQLTGDTHYYIVLNREPPKRTISRKAAEALQCIKASIDIGSFWASRELNPKVKLNDTCSFPWADSLGGSKKRLEKNGRIPECLWQTILDFKPFPHSSAPDTVSSLVAIANKGRHSLGVELVPTSRLTRTSGLEIGPKGASVYVGPFEEGDRRILVLTVPSDSFVKGALAFAIGAYFNHPTLAGIEVAPGLRDFSAYAERAISALEGAVTRNLLSA